MRSITCKNCGFECSTRAERCPECGTHLQLKRSSVSATLNQYPRGYRECDWLAGDEHCLYPGTMSSSTNGEGKFFCRGHFECYDPVVGADVVAASQDYVHHDPRDIAKLQAEARAYCEKLGLDSTLMLRRELLESCRKLALHLTSRRVDTSWAERIFKRVLAGERVPAYSIDLAEAALKLSSSSK